MAPSGFFEQNTKVPDDRVFEFNNDPDSDDSSEQNRTKRGGNNHFGSTGILKCLTCRKRKGKCEYNDAHESCRFCSDRSLSCGEKLSAKGARAHELSQQLAALQREAGMVPFPDVSKLSAIAAHLEQRYPHASIGEIYAMAKPTVENAIAVQVAGGNRNNPSTVLFRTPQIGESISNRSSFSRPISRKPSFNQDTTATQMRGSPSHSSQHQPNLTSQPLPLPDNRAPNGPPNATTSTTPTYDLDSWFGPMQPSQTAPPPSSSSAGHPHPQVQHDAQMTDFQNPFYSPVRPRPRHRHQQPHIHTDESQMDYSSLFDQ